MIAIIDDDSSVREAVRSLVRSLGHQAEMFSSAQEYLRSNRIDESECIITDLQMPGMSGAGLQHHLIESGRRKPLILMSALSSDATATETLKIESCRFLRKPFSDDRLIECLDWALRNVYVKAPPTQPSNEEYLPTRSPVARRRGQVLV
jgi:FixJ family two-component response regulator